MTTEKLVRDRIPDIIRADGRECDCRTVDGEEYRRRIMEKLDEEVGELRESGSIEEMADVLEVMIAMAAMDGHTLDDILRAAEEKRAARGGFAKGYVVRFDRSRAFRGWIGCGPPPACPVTVPPVRRREF